MIFFLYQAFCLHNEKYHEFPDVITPTVRTFAKLRMSFLYHPFMVVWIAPLSPAFLHKIGLEEK